MILSQPNSLIMDYMDQHWGWAGVYQCTQSAHGITPPHFFVSKSNTWLLEFTFYGWKFGIDKIQTNRNQPKSTNQPMQTMRIMQTMQKIHTKRTRQTMQTMQTLQTKQTMLTMQIIQTDNNLKWQTIEANLHWGRFTILLKFVFFFRSSVFCNMGIPTVNKCCCGCQLKTGVIIVGVMALVGSQSD